MKALGWRRQHADSAIDKSADLLNAAEKLAETITDPAARVEALVKISDGRLRHAAARLMAR